MNIEQNNVIDQVLALAVAINTNTVLESEGNAVVIPEGYALKNMESFNEAPKRFRGKFRTQQIDQFAAYINANGSNATRIYIDPESRIAHAIIDNGTTESPQWGSHTADIKLKLDPELDVLLEQDGTIFSQQGLIDFAFDRQPHLSFYRIIDGKYTTLETASATADLRKLTVKKGSETTVEQQNFAASASAIEQIEILAKGTTPPDGFIFTIEPAQGLPPMQFDCELRMKPHESEVRLTYRIKQRQAKMTELADRFKRELYANITIEGAPIYLGTISYQF